MAFRASATFSCDIAYSVSPAAWRASLGSRYSRTRTPLPFLSSTTPAARRLDRGTPLLAHAPGEDRSRRFSRRGPGSPRAGDGLPEGLVHSRIYSRTPSCPRYTAAPPRASPPASRVPLHLGVHCIQHRVDISAVVCVNHAWKSSTFSCDIAYSERPTASRASLIRKPDRFDLSVSELSTARRVSFDSRRSPVTAPVHDATTASPASRAPRSSSWCRGFPKPSWRCRAVRAGARDTVDASFRAREVHSTSGSAEISRVDWSRMLRRPDQHSSTFSCDIARAVSRLTGGDEPRGPEAGTTEVRAQSYRQGAEDERDARHGFKGPDAAVGDGREHRQRVGAGAARTRVGRAGVEDGGLPVHAPWLDRRLVAGVRARQARDPGPPSAGSPCGRSAARKSTRCAGVDDQLAHPRVRADRRGRERAYRVD